MLQPLEACGWLTAPLCKGEPWSPRPATAAPITLSGEHPGLSLKGLSPWDTEANKLVKIPPSEEDAIGKHR